MFNKIVAFILLSIVSVNSYGYLAIGESGEVLPMGALQLNGQTQFFTNNGGGANGLVSLDAPWADGMSSRFTLGGGKISPTLGASYKWIPFPDVDRQPAIGFKTQAWYGRYESENLLTFQFAPLISRKFNTDQGLFIPYFAVPFNYTNARDRNYGNQQFVLGTEYKHPDAQPWTFGGEIAFELHESFSFLMFTVGYQFDSAQGLKLKTR